MCAVCVATDRWWRIYLHCIVVLTLVILQQQQRPSDCNMALTARHSFVYIHSP